MDRSRNCITILSSINDAKCCFYNPQSMMQNVVSTTHNPNYMSDSRAHSLIEQDILASIMCSEQALVNFHYHSKSHREFPNCFDKMAYMHLNTVMQNSNKQNILRFRAERVSRHLSSYYICQSLWSYSHYCVLNRWKRRKTNPEFNLTRTSFFSFLVFKL